MVSGSADDSDRVLMERLRQSRDPAAIAEIVRRYGGMVYGACLRRCEPAAAAAACETVFRGMVETPALVTGALPVWLHAAVLRNSGGRGEAPAGSDADWSRIAPQLDAAIGTLAPLDRWHILVGLCALPPRGHAQSQQQDFAEALAFQVSTSIAALAERMTAVPAPTVLRTLIEQHAIEVIPSELSARLGRLALASLPSASSETLPPALSRARLYLGVSIGLLVLVLVLAGLVYVLSDKASETASERRQQQRP